MTDIQILVAIFAALSFADVATTKAFRARGIQEGNPKMRELLDRYGIEGLFLAKYAVFAAVLIFAAEGIIPWATIFAVDLIQLGIVIWNTYVIHKRKVRAP